MSIPNLLYKIKGSKGIDNTRIMYLCVIVFVGLASFGLGRLSVDNSNSSSINSNKVLITTNTEPNTKIKNTKNIGDYEQAIITDLSTAQPIMHKYVASKNGKLYYSDSCSGASRIKPENQIRFKSSSDAEKSGYKLSTSCKK